MKPYTIFSQTFQNTKKEIANIGKHFFDFEDGDFGFAISDNMAMDSDGNMMMRMSDNMVIDLDSSDIHVISSWPNEDKDEE